MGDETQDTTVQTDDSVTQDTVDWQKRFTDTQAEYTKNQQALKSEQEVWEDEQAVLARIAEKYPHLIAEEDETVDDDDSSFEDEPESLTKAEFKAWQDEQTAIQTAEKEQTRFEQDFTKFVGDHELPPIVEQGLRAGSYKNPEELEAAINGAIEYLDTLGGTKRKKRPTTPLQGGKTATGVPDYGDMTRDQVNAAMVERARALEAQ